MKILLNDTTEKRQKIEVHLVTFGSDVVLTSPLTVITKNSRKGSSTKKLKDFRPLSRKTDSNNTVAFEKGKLGNRLEKTYWKPRTVFQMENCT